MYLVNAGLIQEGEQRAAEGRGRALVVDHGHLDAHGVAAHAQADEWDLDDGQEELEAQWAGTTEERRREGVNFRHRRQSSARLTVWGCAPTLASSSCASWSWPSGRQCFSTWAAGVGLAPSSRLKAEWEKHRGCFYHYLKGFSVGRLHMFYIMTWKTDDPTTRYYNPLWHHKCLVCRSYWGYWTYLQECFLNHFLN